MSTTQLGTVQDHVLLTPDGEQTVTGVLLGFATSHRDQHNHPMPRDESELDSNWKCSACRWVEIRILRDTDNTYVVHTLGRSDVEGEIDRSRLSVTESPYEILELLTDRRGGRNPRLPIAAARAIAQAAANDEEIENAYINRAVA